MLASLNIKNIAVIKEVDVDFFGAFEVLTGETGAGKSILIDSLNLVMGEKTRSDIIRSGEDSAKVSAMFYCENAKEILEECGLDTTEDNEILLERTIFKNGRNISKINGSTVNTATLAAVSARLISIHGQRDTSALLNENSQLLYLDTFAGLDGAREEFSALYAKYTTLNKEITELSAKEGEKKERCEFLKYRINEIESAKLTVGEEEELREKREQILSKQKIISGLSGAYNLLYESSNSAYNTLYGAGSCIKEAAGVLSAAGELYTRADELCVLSKELSSDIMALLGSIDELSEDVTETEDRLSAILGLKRKFSMEVDEILALKDEMEQELLKTENSKDYLLALEKEKDEIYEKMLALSKELTEKRKAAAEILSKDILNELFDLSMEKVKFKVELTPCEFKKTGADLCEFLVSPNPGEALKPVSKIASGGELSRIMLAIKTVLSKTEQGKTYIFDEIDSGVSGRAAQKIAQKLRLMGKNRQVLAITHLPQLAAMGNHHYLIEKNQNESTTNTSVTKIDGESRINEVARIIGGVKITDLTLENAKQMLLLAEKES